MKQQKQIKNTQQKNMKRQFLLGILFLGAIYAANSQTGTVASPFLDVQGPLKLRGDFTILNNAQTDFVPWAKRVTNFSEIRLDLTNINNIDVQGRFQVVGPLYTRQNLYTVNKAESAWISWATKNVTTPETTIDLSNLNNVLLSGKLAIGTTTPDGQLTIVEVGSTLTVGGHSIGFNRNYVDGKIYNQQSTAWQINGEGTGFAIQGFNGAFNQPFKILNNGDVGIGTPNPKYKLDVIGTIRAREIKVDLSGADFVFEKDYKLMPLKDLDKFVKKNKHLPEIAPAKEMEENGTNLGNLNSKFLQKIEELTLYVISQNQSIEELKQLVKLQNEKIQKLEAAIK